MHIALLRWIAGSLSLLLVAAAVPAEAPPAAEPQPNAQPEAAAPAAPAEDGKEAPKPEPQKKTPAQIRAERQAARRAKMPADQRALEEARRALAAAQRQLQQQQRALDLQRQRAEQAAAQLEQAKAGQAEQQAALKQIQGEIAALQKKAAATEQAIARAQQAVEARQEAATKTAAAVYEVEKARLALVEAESDAIRNLAAAQAAVAEEADVAKLPALPETTPETVHVTPHRLDVNGRTTIPVNMFGQHASNLSQEQFDAWGITGFRQIYQNPSAKPVVPGDRGVPGAPDYVVPDVPYILECWFDRYMVVFPVRDPKGWRDHFKKLATEYGEAAKATGRVHHIQFWNEPIWNGPSGPGQNFDGFWYDRTDTTEGKPATIKGMSEPTKHLVWKGTGWRALDPETKWVDYLATRYAPRKIEENGQQRDIKEGDVVEWRGKKWVWEQMPWVDDPTRHSVCHPGQQHVEWYAEQFAEFGKHLKAANPDVMLNAGWGFNIFSWGWKGWQHVYKPVVDAGWQYMDGLSEHHYGADCRMTATSYEVVNAYVLGNYEKRLKFYNTECGVSAGSPPGVPEGLEGEKQMYERWDRKWLDYSVRDLSFMLSNQLDKAFARAEHMPHNNKGTRYSFMMFKQLRGDLVYTRSDDPKIWATAAHDTDADTLCVIVYNDDGAPRTVPVAIDAPAGMQLASGYADRHTALAYQIRLEAQPLAVSDPRRYSSEVEIPGRTAVKFLFHLVGEPEGLKTVKVRQFVAPEILQTIEMEKPFATKIAIDKQALETAEKAICRLAIQDWDAANRSRMLLNGQPLELAPQYNWLNDIAIDPARLKETNEVAFEHIGDGETRKDKRPFHVFMVSFMTVSRPQ